MTSPSRPAGRRLTTRSGTSDPSGAVIPEPRMRRRADARDDAPEDTVDEDVAPSDAQTQVPAEVVHLIPAEDLDEIDTDGMSMPVGVGEHADAVSLPGDSVLTRPDSSNIPTDAELDRRDAAKGTRRKRTGPPPPARDPELDDAPVKTGPPSTDPS